MRLVRCDDCGKLYNYDDDGFCPRCGAFNQPAKSAQVSATGDVVRVDGINEAGHAESFAHREFHEEERERRRLGLNQPERKPSVSARPARQQKAGKAPAASAIAWFIFLIVIFNLLRNLLF